MAEIHELFPRTDNREPNVLEKHLDNLKRFIDGEVRETAQVVLPLPGAHLKVTCSHVETDYDQYMAKVQGPLDPRLESLSVFTLATPHTTAAQLKIVATVITLAATHAVKSPECKLAASGAIVYYYRTVCNTLCVLQIQTTN